MAEVRPCAKLADIEKEHILATLEACNGNRTRAAEVLGISVRCLRNKLHLYLEEGAEVPEPKTRSHRAA
jgi:DNA-binding NtrC family response regulator